MLLYQAKEAKYVHLLLSLCSCQGSAITSNQKSVTNLLFHKSKDALMMPLLLEGDALFILLPGDCSSRNGGALPRRMLIRDFITESDPHVFQYVPQWGCLCGLLLAVVGTPV